MREEAQSHVLARIDSVAGLLAHALEWVLGSPVLYSFDRPVFGFLMCTSLVPGSPAWTTCLHPPQGWAQPLRGTQVPHTPPSAYGLTRLRLAEYLLKRTPTEPGTGAC